MKKKTYFVIPGIAPTLHAFVRFKLLITLLLPTLGKPGEKYKEVFYFFNKCHLQAT